MLAYQIKFSFFIQKNYILLIRLLQLSWFFPLCPTSTQYPPLPQTIPTPLFMSMGHVYKYFGYSIFCTLCPHGYSVTIHLYFLIPSPLHPFPHTPSGKHQNTLCIHDSFSVLVCIVCFLGSVVERYIFIAILLFIVLKFFFLNKSL